TVCVAVTTCGPPASGVGAASVQSPAASAVVVPIDAPSTKTSTVAFGSAVPAKVGAGPVVSPSVGAVTGGGRGGQSMPPSGAETDAVSGTRSRLTVATGRLTRLTMSIEMVSSETAAPPGIGVGELRPTVTDAVPTRGRPIDTVLLGAAGVST